MGTGRDARGEATTPWGRIGQYILVGAVLFFLAIMFASDREKRAESSDPGSYPASTPSATVADAKAKKPVPIIARCPFCGTQLGERLGAPVSDAGESTHDQPCGERRCLTAAGLWNDHPHWPQDECYTIARGEAWIGMSGEQAEAAWGTPADVNKTVGAYGVHEQWCYDGNRYLYVDDGILTTWQGGSATAPEPPPCPVQLPPSPAEIQDAQKEFRSLSRRLGVAVYDYEIALTSRGAYGRPLREIQEDLGAISLDTDLLYSRTKKPSHKLLADATHTMGKAVSSGDLVEIVKALERTGNLLRRAGASIDKADIAENRLYPPRLVGSIAGPRGLAAFLDIGGSVRAGDDWHGWRVTKVTTSSIALRSPRGTQRTFDYAGREITPRKHAP